MPSEAGSAVTPPPAPFMKRLARLAAPNMLATLTQAMLSIVEAWRLGALGGTALAGVALVFPLFMLAGMLSAGAFGGAVSGATARAIGGGNLDRAEGILRTALVVGVGGGLLMGMTLLAVGPAFYELLGGQGEVLRASLDYSNVLMSGLVLIWLFNQTSSVLRGSGNMVTPLIGIVLITAVHFVAGGIMIPRYGMSGAAGALLIGFGAGFLFVLASVLRKNARIRLRPGRVPGDVVKVVLKNGTIAGSQSFMTIGLALLTTALVSRLGDDWLAGYGIGVRLELLMVPVIFGIGGALIALVGAEVGAGRRAVAVKFAWKGTFVTAVIVSAIGIVGALWPALWSDLFTSDAEVARACALYLSIVGPFYGFFALAICLYFNSQAFQTMSLPALGAALRLLIVASGGFALYALDMATPSALFMLVAGAMAFFGLFVAAALHFGPWSARRIAAPRPA